jgi:hypothetical protein
LAQLAKQQKFKCRPPAYEGLNAVNLPQILDLNNPMGSYPHEKLHPFLYEPEQSRAIP